VLRRLGIEASHETFFTASRRGFDEDDRRAYRSAPANDVSLFAAPFLADAGVASIHLVRDPVDTVNSLLHLRLPLSCSHELCEFIRYWIEPEGDSDEEQWADYWIKWNALCARAASVTVRVEALSSGEPSDDPIGAIVGSADFLREWQGLPRTTNRLHAIQRNLVPDHVAARLRGAGTPYGYGA
jgi:hypothetical protein